MLFPLGMSPFEECMLLDDHPAYPMQFIFRLRFRGRLDAQAFAAATEVAVARHRLLGAVVRPTGVDDWEWVDDGAPPVVPRWCDGGPQAVWQPPPLDLHIRPGLQPSIFPASETTDLLLQFHHSACDGLGALAFLRDVLLEYAGRSQPATWRPGDLPPLDPERLRQRASFGMDAAQQEATLAQQLEVLAGLQEIFDRPATPAVPDEPATTPWPSGPGVSLPVVSYTLSPEETARLRAYAWRNGVTTNELLLRDLLLALGRWRNGFGYQRDEDLLRVTVPVNARLPADQATPAANLVSMVFLDRQPRHLARAERLLRGLHNEMQMIKRLGLGVAYALSLNLAKRRGIPFRPQFQADLCRATCVCSTLGTVLDELALPRCDGLLRVGDVLLEDVQFCPPLRPRTYLATGWLRYAGRTSLALQFDPRIIPRAAATGLLADLVRQIEHTVYDESGEAIPDTRSQPPLRPAGAWSPGLVLAPPSRSRTLVPDVGLFAPARVSSTSSVTAH
jgi:hypothetical protein